MEISTTATAPLDEAEVSELESLVAQAYGVDFSEVTSVTGYAATGTLIIDMSDDISNEDVVEDLTTALALSLGVAEDRVTISLDAETGEVSYIVTATDYDDTSALLDILETPEIVDSLMDATKLVDIVSVDSNDEIIAQVDVIVNGDDVTVPLQQAENVIDALLGDQYESHMEGNSKVLRKKGTSLPKNIHKN